MTRRQRRGFTIIEMVIVVAIIGIVAAIALPGLRDNQFRQKVRGHARGTIGALREARAFAVSRANVPGLKCMRQGFWMGYDGPGYDCPAPQSVALRVVESAGGGRGEAYEIVAESWNGTIGSSEVQEVVIQTVDFRALDADNQVEFVFPPFSPPVARFTPSGTLVGAVPQFRLVDKISNEEHYINMTLAGFASLTLEPASGTGTGP